MNVKNIIIVDDHPLITEGIKLVIEQKPYFHIQHVIHNLEDLWDKLSEEVDLLILDINVKGKNSIEVIDDIKLLYPEIKILIFSSYNKPSIVRKAISKDIDGYLLKDTGEKELIEALSDIFGGSKFFGSGVPKLKIRYIDRHNELDDFFSKRIILSEREKEVVALLIEGLGTKEISERLFITMNTVQTHRKNIYKKMKVRSVAGLIKLLHNL
jgi:DNA-binding NarL/FixJ family response regulator